MSDELADSGLGALPCSPGSLRFIALYGTRADATVRRSRLLNALPAAALFKVSPTRPSYHEWMSAAADQLPAIAGLSTCDGDAVSLGLSERLVSVTACWTWTFDVEEAGFVLAIVLDCTLQSEAHLIDAVGALFDDFDTDRLARRLNGRSLGENVDLELGFDFHAIIALPTEVLPEQTAESVQALVSRRWHLSLPRFVTASLHEPSHGFPDGVVAVTPGASVICGIGDDSAMAVIVCAAQALSAVATLRDLQHEVYRTAVSVARSGQASRGMVTGSIDQSRALEDTAGELAEHELDLSLAVERFAVMRLFLPVWRIEQYHRTLLEVLGVERATAVTAKMLDRVSAAVGARQAAATSKRWRRVERQRRSVSAVGGAAAFVAVPLTLLLGFLSIGVKPVGPEGSVFRAELVPYYVSLVGLVFLASGAAWWYVRHHPEGWLESRRSLTGRDKAVRDGVLGRMDR